MLSFCACGGGSSSAPPPATGTGGGTVNTGGAIVTPTVVTTAAGGTVSGVDINVPSATPALNALVLGAVDPTSTGGSAFSTGATVNRGKTFTVLLFGTGLSSAATITISGPGDITVTNSRNITSTTGKPGVAFTATIDPAAALGARTVRIQNGTDLTTFTGGLEVIP